MADYNIEEVRERGRQAALQAQANVDTRSRIWRKYVEDAKQERDLMRKTSGQLAQQQAEYLDAFLSECK